MPCLQKGQTILHQRFDALLLFGLQPDTAVMLNGNALKMPSTVDVDGRQALVVPLKENKPDSAAPVSRYRAARDAEAK